MDGISLLAAFSAGLVSFLAPCVLPLIPGFLSYLGGSTLAGAATKRWDIFLNSVFFVVGFSLVFATLGVLLNTLLEAVAYDAQIWLARIGGAIIIFFGFYLMGLFHIPWLETEHKFKIAASGRPRFVTSFLFGLGFAAGWTPCVGPALGIILGLATSQPSAAFFLLLSYALGLGLPFLLVGLFVSQANNLIKKIGPMLRYINIGFGVVLTLLGILVFTRTLNLIADWQSLEQLLSR